MFPIAFLAHVHRAANIFDFMIPTPCFGFELLGVVPFCML